MAAALIEGPQWLFAALPLFIGRNVYRMLFKSKAYERNELFLPGRMAYVVDLDDEYADTDIPTTLIRSKADCPTMEVSNPNPESLEHESQTWKLALILPQPHGPHLTHHQVLFTFHLLNFN